MCACYWETTDSNTTAMFLLARLRGVRLLDPALLTPPFLIRVFGEMFGICLGFSALALLPLSLVTAIGQSTPIIVTFGAALVLGETVGWRRSLAGAIGLAGVLLIVRPGTAEFHPAALLAVASVFAFAARDLATRRCPPHLATVQLNFWGYATILPASTAMLLTLPGPPTWPGAVTWLQLGAASLLGVSFYWTLTLALRMGEASVIGPLRYARIVFVLILATLFLGERPDAPMLAGIGLVVCSGLYTLLREARLKRRARLLVPSPVPSPVGTPPV